jgi:hypothetical protein
VGADPAGAGGLSGIPDNKAGWAAVVRRLPERRVRPRRARLIGAMLSAS